MLVQRLSAKYVDTNPFFFSDDSLLAQISSGVKLPDVRASISDEVNVEHTSTENSSRLVSMMTWLRNEVTKFLNSNRISETSLTELDTKV
jgi:hypothetical protein